MFIDEPLRTAIGSDAAFFTLPAQACALSARAPGLHAPIGTVLAFLVRDKRGQRPARGAAAMSGLRSMVEKWIAPGPATSVRVRRCSRYGSARGRHVRVDVVRPTGQCCLHFFEHDDGGWQVLPPECTHLTMGAHLASTRATQANAAAAAEALGVTAR